MKDDSDSDSDYAAYFLPDGIADSPPRKSKQKQNDFKGWSSTTRPAPTPGAGLYLPSMERREDQGPKLPPGLLSSLGGYAMDSAFAARPSSVGIIGMSPSYANVSSPTSLPHAQGGATSYTRSPARFYGSGQEELSSFYEQQSYGLQHSRQDPPLPRWSDNAPPALSFQHQYMYSQGGMGGYLSPKTTAPSTDTPQLSPKTSFVGPIVPTLRAENHYQDNQLGSQPGFSSRHTFSPFSSPGPVGMPRAASVGPSGSSRAGLPLQEGRQSSVPPAGFPKTFQPAVPMLSPDMSFLSASRPQGGKPNETSWASLSSAVDIRRQPPPTSKGGASGARSSSVRGGVIGKPVPPIPSRAPYGADSGGRFGTAESAKGRNTKVNSSPMLPVDGSSSRSPKPSPPRYTPAHEREVQSVEVGQRKPDGRSDKGSKTSAKKQKNKSERERSAKTYKEFYKQAPTKVYVQANTIKSKPSTFGSGQASSTAPSSSKEQTLVSSSSGRLPVVEPKNYVESPKAAVGPGVFDSEGETYTPPHSATMESAAKTASAGGSEEEGAVVATKHIKAEDIAPEPGPDSDSKSSVSATGTEEDEGETTEPRSQRSASLNSEPSEGGEEVHEGDVEDNAGREMGDIRDEMEDGEDDSNDSKQPVVEEEQSPEVGSNVEESQMLEEEVEALTSEPVEEILAEEREDDGVVIVSKEPSPKRRSREQELSSQKRDGSRDATPRVGTPRTKRPASPVAPAASPPKSKREGEKPSRRRQTKPDGAAAKGSATVAVPASTEAHRGTERRTEEPKKVKVTFDALLAIMFVHMTMVSKTVLSSLAVLSKEVMTWVFKFHHRAFMAVSANHHVAFCFTFLYAFPYLVAYVIPWAPPWAPVCLWYAFLVQLFCAQGPTAMVAFFRLVLPLSFLVEGVSHHSFLLDLNGAELLLISYILAAVKTRKICSPIFLLSLAAQVVTSVFFGSYLLVQWFQLVLALFSLYAISVLDGTMDEKDELPGFLTSFFKSQTIPTAPSQGMEGFPAAPPVRKSKKLDRRALAASAKARKGRF